MAERGRDTGRRHLTFAANVGLFSMYRFSFFILEWCGRYPDLSDRTSYPHLFHAYYDVYMFSKSGFADDLLALDDPNVHLVTIEDMTV